VTDWTNDDALRESIIAEIAATLPLPMRPGDFTAEQFAAQTGMTVPTARYRLGQKVDAGELLAVRADVPGRPRPTTVYRRP
jgi:predicted ArsR family transcriptional regulator